MTLSLHLLGKFESIVKLVHELRAVFVEAISPLFPVLRVDGHLLVSGQKLALPVLIRLRRDARANEDVVPILAGLSLDKKERLQIRR